MLSAPAAVKNTVALMHEREAIGANVIKNNALNQLAEDINKTENTPPNRKLKKSAEKIIGITESGKDISKRTFRNIGKLYEGVQTAQAEQLRQSEKQAVREAIKSEVRSRGIKNADEAAKVIYKAVYGQLSAKENSIFESADGADIVNKILNSEEVKAKTQEKAAENFVKIIQTAEMASGRSDSMRSAMPENRFEVNPEGETVNTKTNEPIVITGVASVKDGEMLLKTESGETVNAADVSFASEGEALLYSTVLDMGVGAGVAESLIKNFDPQGNIPAVDYALGIEEAYRYGRYHIPVREMSLNGFSAVLTEQQKMHAYNLGAARAEAETTERQARVNAGETKNTADGGSVKYQNRITADMTDNERAEILRNKTIINIADVKKISENNDLRITEISSWDDINKVFGSKKRALIQKIASEFGVFKNYNNKDINLSFDFSNNNFRESYHKQKVNYEQFSKMFSVFDSVIEKAVGVEIHNRENYKPDVTLNNVYVLISAFADGDFVIPVKLEIKEFKDKPNTLYVAIALEKIKMTEVSKQGTTENGVAQNSRSVTISISDLLSKINPKDINFLKYIPDELLNENQIEAKRAYFEKEKDTAETAGGVNNNSGLSPTDNVSDNSMPNSAGNVKENTAYSGKNKGNLAITPSENNLFLQTSETLNGTVSTNSIPNSDGNVKQNNKAKGKVHIGVSVNSMTERQKTSLAAIGRIVSEVTHNDVYIYESVEKDGKRVFKNDTAGYKAGESAPNGFYVSDTGEIYIDLNAGNSGEGLMLFTMAHEITHFIRQWSPAKFKILADFLMEQYGRKGISVDTLIREQIDKAKRNGRDIDYDEGYEEVISSSMEGMLADGKVFEKLALLKERDAGLVEKIKSIIQSLINRIKKAYAGLTPESREGKLVAGMIDIAEKMRDLLIDALIDAGENFSNADVQRNTDIDTNKKLQARENLEISDEDYAKLLSKKPINVSKETKAKIGKQRINRYGNMTDEQIPIVDIFRLADYNKVNVAYKYTVRNDGKDYFTVIRKQQIKPDSVPRKLNKIIQEEIENARTDKRVSEARNGRNNNSLNNNVLGDGGKLQENDNVVARSEQSDQERYNAQGISNIRRGVKNLEVDGKVPHAKRAYLIKSSTSDKSIPNSAKNVKQETENKHFDRDYSYEALTAKRDMEVTVLDGEVPTNRADVVVEAKKNAASVGKRNSDGSVSVYVEDIDTEVVLSTDGLKHSLDRRFENNAPITLKAGEILQNSILINELVPEKAEADKSYVLIGAAKSNEGQLYIVRSVINRFSNELMSMDVLYAINAKGSRLRSMRPGIQPPVTDSTISITKLLEYVNRYFPDILPEGVLKHFGHAERPSGKLGESALFSDRDYSDSRNIERGRKKYYNEFDSLAMQWANSAGTEQGDRKIIFNGKSHNACLAIADENSDGGYRIVMTGGYKEVKEFAETGEGKNESFDRYAEVYESMRGRDIRDLFIHSDGGVHGRNSGTADSEQGGTEEHISTENAEHVRSDNRGLSAEIKDSDRDPDAVSNRALLSRALETAAQNEIELKRLREYQSKAALIDAEQKRLSDLRGEIKELSFAKGKRDTEKLAGLHEEAAKTANRLDIYDRQLLRLEAAKPLRALLERERTAAEKRQRQRDAETLKAYREKALEKQQAITEKYREARRKAVESRRKTVMRNKIKRVIKQLDGLLNRGNREKNVKIGLRETVSSALAASEILFSDVIENADIVRRGVEISVKEDAAALGKYAKLLKQRDAYEGRIAALEGDSTAERKSAELNGMLKKLDGKIKKLDKQLAKVFEAERERLNRADAAEVLTALAEAYRGLRYSGDEYIKNAYDSGVQERLDALKESIGGTPVRDMSLSQLEEVYKAFRAVEHTVRTANSLFREGRTEDLRETTAAVQGEIRKAARAGLRDPLAAVDRKAEGIRSFMWNELKPYYAFERLGSETYTRLFRDAVEGESTYGRDIDEAHRYITGLMEKYGFKKWDMSTATVFKTPSGQDFRLTLDDMLSVYAYSKREQAYRHMTEGGFTFDRGSTYRDEKTGLMKKHRAMTETYRVSEELIDKITDTLTAEQKQFADGMLEYLEVMADKGNEVSRELYGIDLFTEKNYFPLKTEKDYRSADEQALGGVQLQSSLKNAGMTRQTVPGANNPIVLSGFTYVIVNHIDGMAKYHGLVLPIENLRRVFNNVSVSGTGGYISTQALIKAVYGESAVKYFDRYIADLNGGIMSGDIQSPLMNLFSRMKGTAVAANLSVAIQQPFAITRAWAEINPKYFIPFMKKEASAAETRSQWEELKKYAPIAVIKEMGGFDVGSGRAGNEYVAASQRRKGASGFAKNASDLMMWGAETGDKIGWSTIWRAVKKEAADRQGLTPGTEEFYKAAGKRFTEIVVKTQVYDSVNSRSGFMRSKSDLMKFATSFMGEPTAVYNMAFSAALDFKRAVQSREGVMKASMRLLRVSGALLISIALNNAFKALVYAMRDDDEDEAYWERYAKQSAQQLKSDLNPFNLLPITRDIVSVFEGWEVERPDMTLIADLITSAQKLSGGDGGTEEWLDFAGALGNITGIPFKNICREIEGAVNVFGDITDGREATDVSGAFITGWNGSNDFTLKDRAERAAGRGDYAEVKRIADEMTERKL